MTWCHFGNRSCLSTALPWEMSASDSENSPCCTHQSMVSQLQNHWGHDVHSPCAPPTLSCALPWPYFVLIPVKCSYMPRLLGGQYSTDYCPRMGVWNRSHRCLQNQVLVSQGLRGTVSIKCCSTSCILKHLAPTLPKVPVFFNHPSLPPKVLLPSYRTVVGCSTLLQVVIKCKSTAKTLLNI